LEVDSLNRSGKTVFRNELVAQRCDTQRKARKYRLEAIKAIQGVFLCLPLNTVVSLFFSLSQADAFFLNSLLGKEPIGLQLIDNCNNAFSQKSL